MKTSISIPLLPTFALGALFFLTVSASASTHGPSEEGELVGWSSDHQFVAYRNVWGWWDIENKLHNWDLEIVTVKRLPTLRTEATFQVTKNAVPAATETEQFRKRWYVQNKDRIEEYAKARPATEWAEFAKLHEFKKPLSALTVSPSGKWTIHIETKEKNVSIVESAKASEQLSADSGSDRNLHGTVLQYRLDGIGKSETNWPLIVIARANNADVQLAKQICRSTPNGSPCRSQGYLAVYWAPDEKSAAIEWYWAPTPGGGELSDISVGTLP
jgi:hypothetical protein